MEDDVHDYWLVFCALVNKHSCVLSGASVPADAALLPLTPPVLVPLPLEPEPLSAGALVVPLPPEVLPVLEVPGT